MEREFIEAAWEYLLQNEDRIRKIFRWMSPQHEDELWSDVAVVRIARILELYESDRGTRWQCVSSNLKGYASKHLKKINNIGMPASVSMRGGLDKSEVNGDDERSGLSGDLSMTYTIDRDALEMVQTILDKIDDYDAAILVMRHIGSYTFQEIADEIQVSKATANNHYHRAMAKAQEVGTGLDIGANPFHM